MRCSHDFLFLLVMSQKSGFECVFGDGREVFGYVSEKSVIHKENGATAGHTMVQ